MNKMKTAGSVENITLYLFQGIACLFVIEIHNSLNFPGSELLYRLARFAVPFFFLISGYFSYHEKYEIIDKMMWRRGRRNVPILLISFGLYFIYNILLLFLFEGNISSLLKNFTEPKNLFYFVALQWSTPYIGVGHMWFYFALMLIYITFSKISRFKDCKGIYILSLVILFLVYIVELMVANSYFSISEIWYRNFLLFGLPLFLCGVLIKKYENTIIKCFTTKSIFLCIMSVGGLFMLESMLIPGIIYLYLNSICIAILLMIIAIKWPNCVNSKCFMVRIGKKYSKWIYISHYAFIMLFNYLNVERNISFVLVVLGSVLVAMIIEDIIKNKIVVVNT